MSDIYVAKEEMHQLEAALYPNHLAAGSETSYLAKNTKEKTINVEAICAAMKNRGGYEGSYDEAVKTVHHFFKEMMYQLCDGFSVNTGWFTVNAHIGGVFHSVKESFDPQKHPVTFKFHKLKAMRRLTELIEVVISGHVDEPAFISEFNDMETPDSGNLFEPGHVSEIVGRRIKIEGPGPDVGLWFVPVPDPTKRVKVARIVENTPSRVLFIAPPSTGFSENRLEIHTQFSDSTTLLHNVRVITSPMVLTEV
jgi:hypothetical protein